MSHSSINHILGPMLQPPERSGERVPSKSSFRSDRPIPKTGFGGGAHEATAPSIPEMGEGQAHYGDNSSRHAASPRSCKSPAFGLSMQSVPSGKSQYSLASSLSGMSGELSTDWRLLSAPVVAAGMLIVSDIAAMLPKDSDIASTWVVVACALHVVFAALHLVFGRPFREFVYSGNRFMVACVWVAVVGLQAVAAFASTVATIADGGFLNLDGLGRPEALCHFAFVAGMLQLASWACIFEGAGVALCSGAGSIILALVLVLFSCTTGGSPWWTLRYVLLFAAESVLCFVLSGDCRPVRETGREGLDIVLAKEVLDLLAHGDASMLPPRQNIRDVILDRLELGLDALDRAALDDPRGVYNTLLIANIKVAFELIGREMSKEEQVAGELEKAISPTALADESDAVQDYVERILNQKPTYAAPTSNMFKKLVSKPNMSSSDRQGQGASFSKRSMWNLMPTGRGSFDGLGGGGRRVLSGVPPSASGSSSHGGKNWKDLKDRASGSIRDGLIRPKMRMQSDSAVAFGDRRVASMPVVPLPLMAATGSDSPTGSDSEITQSRTPPPGGLHLKRVSASKGSLSTISSNTARQATGKFAGGVAHRSMSKSGAEQDTDGVATGCENTSEDLENDRGSFAGETVADSWGALAAQRDRDSHSGRETSAEGGVTLSDVWQPIMHTFMSKRGVCGAGDVRLSLAPEATTIMSTSLNTWKLNVIELDKAASHRPLAAVGTALLTGSAKELTLDEVRIRHFLSEIESRYYTNAPYHNAMHGADVMNSLSYFLSLKETPLTYYGLTPVERLAALSAAAAHDVGHNGRSNRFHVGAGTPLALLYNDQSVLENMHTSLAFMVLQTDASNYIADLDTDARALFRTIVTKLILETDLAKHVECVGRFRHEFLAGGMRYDAQGSPATLEPPKKHALIGFCLKAADIGHSAKAFDLHVEWTMRITAEFFNQGDVERELGIPCSPFCGRDTTKVYESQSGFFSFIAAPLFTALDEYFHDQDLSKDITEEFNRNREFWKSYQGAGFDYEKPLENGNMLRAAFKEFYTLRSNALE
eukprot:TRINITY_DN59408_c0_g1_i1.p1 TRINITY_DN59408_c0_g1~~TRINITY_DN59408_c0_g1_i1.p1  ORF type:complete len:1050 (+),score=192.14 TRINITY_DN59408_c0_g1_i1:170-3319(+)